MLPESKRAPAASGSPRPIDVFFGYAHRDEPLRDELAKHLSTLKRLQRIRDWYDRDIEPGMEAAATARSKLEQADIILLLISADFMASEPCYHMLVQTLARHRTGEAAGMAVLLRPVDWRGLPLDELWFLPTDRRPVTMWPNIDEAMVDVIQGVWRVVETMERGPPGAGVLFPARRLSTTQQHQLIHALRQRFPTRVAIEPIAVRLGLSNLPNWPADALWNEILQRLFGDNADVGLLIALSGQTIDPA